MRVGAMSEKRIKDMRRRSFLLGASAVALAEACQTISGAAQSSGVPIRLVLLGTKGGPSVRSIDQLPCSNLLVIGDSSYVIDAGYGATYRLAEKGIELKSIRSIFITHHHSDHNLELGPLLYNAWINGLSERIDAYGPNGIDQLLQSYFQSNIIDIETRIEDEGRPDPRKLVASHAYAEGIVMEDANVRVTALRNLHPPIESYSLKFEIKGGETVVFSGDTTYFPPLAAFARGADYLVHEVMYGPALDQVVQRNPGARTLMNHLRAAHTLTEDVGRIAEEAKVKNLVLTHFVPVGNFSIKPDDWIRGVKANYSGNIIVGRDGLEVALSPARQ